VLTEAFTGRYHVSYPAIPVPCSTAKPRVGVRQVPGSRWESGWSWRGV
jgi:hypothetical protein